MLKEATADAGLDLGSSTESARKAGLRFVESAEAGIARRPRGQSFAYFKNHKRVADRQTLARIRKLAIPPAWTNVWICADAEGHIQATGRDARGRKQYRYHAGWQRVRDEAKYGRLLAFGLKLPRMRATIRRHMAKKGLGRRKVLATVVHLLETTLIRVGNQEYSRSNKSYGLTTLEDRHVKFSAGELMFKFRGKTGKEWRLKLGDRRVAKIVRACQDLPGQHLFQYEDAEGNICQVSSTDVNAYLREIAHADVTAKDFRTWAGTVLATMALKEFDRVDSEAAAKRNVRQAIQTVAARLGNTATICRKCYVHPQVITSYMEGSLAATLRRRVEKELRQNLAKLPPAEAAVLILLQSRLAPRRRKAKAARHRRA